MSQTVLCFHLSKDKEAGIADICKRLGIRQKRILPRDYGQKLGYLAEIQGFTREPDNYMKSEFQTEMLVFSGMDSEQVDAFLAAYKEAGLIPIGLKAVVTPHNIFWSAKQLYQELVKEHFSFL